MNKKVQVILSFFSAIIFFSIVVEGCRKKDLSSKPTPLSFTAPASFPAVQYDFVNNPLTREGFALGRKLFYEGKLSKDGNFSCASCHQQEAAFATVDHDFSHGFNNQFTTRNAPALFNLAWQKEFSFDGGNKSLDQQAEAHIRAPNEMAEEINNVIRKLRDDATYRQLFKAAFGTEEINSQRMLNALSQFEVMLVSDNSKYDQMKRGEIAYSVNEQTGYVLFKSNCASCHQEPLFTDLSYRNNGLSINSTLKDVGRMKVTNKSSDSLKFKVPSLRNVAVTAPYMHDGRFFDLFSVLTHYSSGSNNSPTLDPLLANKIPLTIVEKEYLIAFLNTLTDSTFLKNKQFERPL